ncbi:SusC/RagA family TonB-linked outer membrane protein [Hymenobacter sp. B81]|uniref:SusC/RagA family TonB-linked outer membrane protein n=1 Tax=Hymenobacter sp. B81 TaxID=3344878 RepID=UPI0037DC5A38
MKKPLLMQLLLTAAVAQHAVAQNRTITGRVTDRSNGEGLPGATVLVKGTTAGVSTNADGTFTLDVPAGGTTLVITSVGYTATERVIGNDSRINIGLATDTKTIGEVVVTGYGGSQDVKDITGSYAKLDQSKLTSQPVQSADQALAGRIAGVQITNTSGTLGDAVAVRIRGINSINGSSQPLYVVDGVPMTEFGNFNILTAGLSYNPLADINPNDIESMTVLKDASAAAIYGSRATNGVILITTKRGKAGQVKLSFNASGGFMEATKLPKLLNATEFRDINNEKYFNAFPTQTDPIIVNGDADGDGQEDNTDWLNSVYHKGKMQDYQIALSSGNDRGSYYASVGYSDLNGAIKNNRLRRANARLNFELTPKTWLKTGVTMGFTHAKNEGVLTNRYLAGATVAAYNAPPNVPAYGRDGWYYLNDAGDVGEGNNRYGTYVLNRFFHPIANLELQRNGNTQRRLLGNAYATITPIKELSITTKFGVDYLNNFEDQYSSPFISGLGRSFNGLVQKIRADNTLTTWQNYATYAKLFGENHNVDATVGYEQNMEYYESLYGSAANIVDPKFQDIYDGLFDPSQSGQGGSRDVTAWQSFFGRANYAFSDKYYATFTARYDGSSRFGPDERYGFFPGGSLGWRISRENFMSNLSVVNDLKLRASYGLTGNSAGIGSYASAILIGQGQYGDYGGLGINQLNNTRLRWETGKKLDVGFDLSVLQDRIGVNLDVFSNDVDNLLLAVPAIQSTGIPQGEIVRNVGKMWNRGIEVTVNTTNLQLPNGFKWTSSFNYSYVKNRITQLSEGGDVTTSYPYHKASQGHAITEYYLLTWAGVNPDNGNPRWYDRAGNIREYNPRIADATQRWSQNGETTINGKAVQPLTTASDGAWTGKQSYPTFFGGFDNTFTYKGLQLDLFLQYSGGNYLYNATRVSMLTNYVSNNIDEIKERWTTPGQVTNVPRLHIADNTFGNSSTNWWEKGDFLRVRQIRLSYALPTAISQKMGSSRANVFAMVQNAFVFTKYSGLDPEVSFAGNEGTDSNVAYGVDNRSNPQTRTFTAGINLDF